jgi:hypothetical protein
MYLNRYVDNFQGFFTCSRKGEMLPTCPQILSTKNPHPVDKDVDNLVRMYVYLGKDRLLNWYFFFISCM